jgi:serine/threonine protein kinase
MTIPARIGKYAISELIGRGSMGVVYKGFDPNIQRPVAIKTVHRELLGDPAAIDSIAARFRNEAKAVGRIAHPGVVAIYEFGEDADLTYIAMEYVEGPTLDQVLAVPRMMPESQVLAIMDQLLEALSVAHAQGVWHRDIKPANLILTASGQVKLTDFGIARLSDANLTQVSSMIGTPAYMAPEQFTGGTIDHRADVFACGVLLYRMLTGRRAFTGGSEVVMYKILNEEPAPPSQVTQGARAPAYDAVVARAMRKRAEERYPDVQAMRQALQAIARSPANAPVGATIILPSTSAEASGSAARSQPGLRTELHSSATGIAASGWDPAALSRIERALASHVGPMARVMVRDAARTCADPLSLATAVARHIPEEAKRQPFIAAASGVGQARGGAVGAHATGNTAGGTGGTPLPASSTAADALTDAFKAQALAVVTRKMGPIARVMVRRASDQCGGSKAHFLQLLLEAASDLERPALQHELATLH